MEFADAARVQNLQAAARQNELKAQHAFKMIELDAMSNAKLNEVRQANITKFSPRNIATVAGLVGVGLLTAAMVDAVWDSVQKNVLGPRKSKQYFEKMIATNPRLQREDPEQIAKLWDTLFHNSPHMAEDPIAAGAFLTQMLQKEVLTEYGGPTIDVYNTLTDINRKGQGMQNTLIQDSLIPGLGLL
jgi:Asp-tRNA(Asn)/Glu-tRNA(Gln) amidotransferase B subunit